MISTRTSSFLSLLVGFVLLVGCGGGSSSPNLGDWTLKTDELTVSKDLQVSESEAFYFGRIFDLDVTSEGRMVVADWDAKNIKVLRPDGTLIDTLGGPGEGPGEFQQLRSVQAARGDSVYAYDTRRSRLTVFAPAPSLQLARALTIPRQEGLATSVTVVDDHLVGEFTSTSTPDEGLSRPAPNALRRIGESGTPGDTLLTVRQRKRAMASVNGGYRIRPLPFGRDTRTAIGPKAHLYYGWTDSLRISARTPNGSTEIVADVPTDPIPMQAADRDSMLSDIGSDMKDMIASALPDTKPAFTDLLVANDGRLCVKRPPSAAEADTTPWWVLDPESKTIQEIQLPSEVDLEVMQNGKAYGTTETEMGAPAVVRYRIEEGR